MSCIAAVCFLSTCALFAEEGLGESGLFTVDTRWGFSEGAGISGFFALDTRFSGSAGDGFSDLFTVDTRGAVPGAAERVIALYPTAAYSAATRTLTMTVRGIDPLYGNMSSGLFGWTLELPGVGVIASDTGSYNSGAQHWQASRVFDSSLAPGNYKVRYNLISVLNREGTATLNLAVGGAAGSVSGTVTDAGTQLPLAGAEVALFAAGGANGLWTLVNGSYGGVMPSLATLLAQLTPVRPVITTAVDGVFSWSDVPAGNSYVVVAAKSGYQQQWSSTFPVSGTGAATTRDFAMKATGATVASLSGNVSAVRQAMERLLEANAETMAGVARQYHKDDIYSADIGWFSLMGDLTSAASGGWESLPRGAAKLSKTAFKHAGKEVARELLKAAATQVIAEVAAWCLRNEFPESKLGYLQSQVHQISLHQIEQTEAEFLASAGGQNLAGGFSVGRFANFQQEFLGYAARVGDNRAKYLPSPLPARGNYVFTLEQMGDSYDTLSKALAGLGVTDTILSGIQIVGGAVIIGGAAASATGVGTPVGAPVMALAGATKTAADWGKNAIFVVELEYKSLMAVQFTFTVAVAYPRDNAQLAEAFEDFLTFLEQEAATPFYLRADNRFKANTDVNLKKRLWAIGLIPGWDEAKDTATVTIQDQSTVAGGGNSVSARCLSYCVWEPITLKTLFGSKRVTVQTSSDARGPATVAVGGQTQFSVPYRGHSKNLVSMFKPHYLTVETMIGPWRVNTVSKPFHVLAPGDAIVPISWGASVPLVTADQVYGPAAKKKGRLRPKDVIRAAREAVALVEDSLSAATPTLTAQVTARTNLWAIDLRLFSPAGALVSLLVTDSQGHRLGYSATDGFIYNELPGSVTGPGQSPATLRLLQPPPEEVYTVTVALLNPDAQPVPVSLFQEDEEVSDAILVAMPSRIILDGNRDSVLSADISVVEGSQQKPLTGVSTTLTNLVKWGGTAQLPLLTNATQTLPDIGAGESAGASWAVQVSSSAERGKYVGTVRLNSDQTTELGVPVVAVVRRATEIVSLFEGTNSVSGEPQIIVTNDVGGSGQTWAHIPKGYHVVHAQMGVAGNSTNLLNPTIDIGADGTNEWAFSGVFDLGVIVDNLESAFNDHLASHPGSSNTIAIPIRLGGNAGESMLFGGLQVYLDLLPNELRAVEVLPDGQVQFELLGQPGFRYDIQASSDLLHWDSLGTVTVTNSPMLITDQSAPGNDVRFYRAVLD